MAKIFICNLVIIIMDYQIVFSCYSHFFFLK
jgi:hypothetical protein